MERVYTGMCGDVCRGQGMTWHSQYGLSTFPLPRPSGRCGLVPGREWRWRSVSLGSRVVESQGEILRF